MLAASFIPSRITPAYAGRIIYTYLKIQTMKDHPRIRGKNYAHLPLSHSHTGSPPHTREELDFDLGNVVKYRITPAYAGRIK